MSSQVPTEGRREIRIRSKRCEDRTQDWSDVGNGPSQGLLVASRGWKKQESVFSEASRREESPLEQCF